MEDDSGNWFRSYGKENCEFDEYGLNATRHACINDLPIDASERKFHRPLGHRPGDHPGLSSLVFDRRCDSQQNSRPGIVIITVVMDEIRAFINLLTSRVLIIG